MEHRNGERFSAKFLSLRAEQLLFAGTPQSLSQAHAAHLKVMLYLDQQVKDAPLPSLDASTTLISKGCEPCQTFLREGKGDREESRGT